MRSPRARLLLALAVLVPLGFATKAYAGPGARWVHDSAGGVVYVVFWIVALLALRPTLAPGRVALAVLLATCALETLQLWNPPPLARARSHFLGRTLLGDSFAWWDFPHYVLGAALGLGLARRLSRSTTLSRRRW